MAKSFAKNFSFGFPMAEDDFFLEEAFWDNGYFENIVSLEDPHCFIIGRTGSGKSAAFKHLETNHPGKVIRIVPEQLALPYITNHNAVRQVVSAGTNVDPFFKQLWKHFIFCKILRHRYPAATPAKKRNVIENLVASIKGRDRGAQTAIDYLEKYGDSFWVETSQPMIQIADKIEKIIEANGELNATVAGTGIKTGVKSGRTETHEAKSEERALFQRIISDPQLNVLNQVDGLLRDYILDSPQHITYLVIDDLDNEWVEEEHTIALIRALFHTVLDLRSVRYLKILVALRTNIFEQLNYGSMRRGGQEEKVRAAAMNINWTIADLHELLENRAKAASRKYKIQPPKSLHDMLPVLEKGRDPQSYILDRTLMRPRDAISFLNLCVMEATHRNRISWDNIRHAEVNYSAERVQALRDEWKDPYIGIEALLERFRGMPAKMSADEIRKPFDDIAMLMEDASFTGKDWLDQLVGGLWAPDNSHSSWAELYGDLTALLYKVSFLGFAKGPNGNVKYSYEDQGLSQRKLDLPANVYFEVHPAFRRALEISPRH